MRKEKATGGVGQWDHTKHHVKEVNENSPNPEFTPLSKKVIKDGAGIRIREEIRSEVCWG